MIVLDGIDRCDGREQEELLRRLRTIMHSSNSKLRIKVFITAKDRVNVLRQLTSCETLEMNFQRLIEDVNTFIDTELEANSGVGRLFHDKALKQHVETRLKSKANGRYGPSNIYLLPELI